MFENATELAKVVEYQDGVVASRTIIDKKAGTVTIFAFDKGQGLSEHVAPYDALVCALDGEADVVVSGEKQTLKSGEMLIMSAGAPHSLKAREKFKMMLVMIREKEGKKG